MIRRPIILVGCIITLYLAQLAFCAAVPSTRPTTRPAPKPDFPKLVRAQLKSTLDLLQKNGEFTAANRTLTDLFDQVIASTAPANIDLFRDTDFALRLVRQLDKAPGHSRLELLQFLRANDNLAKTLVFLVRDQNDPAAVFGLLDRLRTQRGKHLDAYANLAAAICVVHDRPLSRNINENKTTAPDALDIYDYYVRNEGRMFFGVRNVPAELLIYVVDTTATIDEMEWALDKYSGDSRVGGRFHDIHYDHRHLRYGEPKRVTVEGFDLPNILEFGGICADQAYFAAAVGKSIGVPAVVDGGVSGTLGHAWVGFLQSNRRSAWWNFDIGRYEAYDHVRGNVQDPQLRETIPDSYVSLLAELVGTRPAERQLGVALTDGALRIIELIKADKNLWPGVLPDGITNVNPRPRKANLDCAFELLEMAIHHSPGDRFCWFPVRDIAAAGELSPDQKKAWYQLLLKSYGQDYPDFLLTMLMPMIKTVDDAQEQDRMWEKAYEMFRSRSDLAASVRMAQGALWESKGDIDEAGRCYMDVIDRFPNSGPFVLDAIAKTEDALKKSDRENRVLDLYELAFSRMHRPRKMAGPFMTQSNWYRTGQLLIARYTQYGEPEKATDLKEKIDAKIQDNTFADR